MRDLSGAGDSCRPLFRPLPASVYCALGLLFLACIAVSLLILVAVRNALMLAALILLSALIISFFLWNSLSFRRNIAIFLFVDRFPASDLLTASDGQLVKITGVSKVGDDSKITPLVTENLIVNATDRSRVVSPTLKRWLEERSLPTEGRCFRLEEGYIEEAASIAVVGVLNKKNGDFVIVPPPEGISTRCSLQKLLLPVSIDGLILRVCSRTS
ncbi:putative membrane protein [Apostasia shenzhenica]|uniref:Putative membrane protein n=1 Tax=Apostasia shenzhenica TaxID=1088818 RepID=A0A2I0AWU2_9ASPA|nr:putative membrane protein [Apostasia shenzhenica]